MEIYIVRGYHGMGTGYTNLVAYETEEQAESHLKKVEKLLPGLTVKLEIQKMALNTVLNLED